MLGLLEYPTFDVRLLKRCFEKTASTVFGRPDPFLMTEIIVTCLKSAEHCDWMQFRQSVLSTVAARSKLGQGFSYFCPKRILRGR